MDGWMDGCMYVCWSVCVYVCDAETANEGRTRRPQRRRPKTDPEPKCAPRNPTPTEEQEAETSQRQNPDVPASPKTGEDFVKKLPKGDAPWTEAEKNFAMVGSKGRAKLGEVPKVPSVQKFRLGGAPKRRKII